MAAHWDLNKVSAQAGRIAIVTGANAGLGYETALALAGKGATVVLACRDLAKAEAAKARMLAKYRSADIACFALDVGSFASVRAFAENFERSYSRCDLLINNAGVFRLPYQKTVDGIETQFAVNYLGHFLLTGLLLPTIVDTPGARIVSLGSLAHLWSTFRFNEINSERDYDRTRAYSHSKSACMMFAFELDQRLQKAGFDTRSVAAHPGMAMSNLGQHFPFPVKQLLRILGPLVLTSAADGAMPTLYAALGEDIRGGEYTGPSGKDEKKGPPTKAAHKAGHVQDQATWRQLWELSEQLTGFTFNVG